MDIIGALTELLCILKNIAMAIVYAGVYLINVVVAAIGAFLQVVILLLPDIPDAPDPPDNEILATLNWLFPLAEFLAAATAFLAMYVVFLGVRVVARWVKTI